MNGPRQGICIAYGGDLSLPNGGTNRLVAVVNACRIAGFDTHVVIPSPERELPEDLRDVSIHEVPIGAGGIKNQMARAVLVSLEAKKTARRNNALLQIQHSGLAGIATMIGCSRFILDMNDLAFDSPFYASLPFSSFQREFVYRMEKKAIDKALKIIAVSNMMKDFVMREWDVSESRIEVVPNGYFGDKTIEQKNSVSEDRCMIARIGTLFRHLNVESLVGLSKSLSGENARIYLIGDGELRPYLEKRIRKEDIRNISITGWLPYEKAIRLTAKAQLTFLTVRDSLTTRAACPTKILDYAALGKPMALSDVSELSRIFCEKEAALVSDPENQDEFIRNAHEILSKRDLASRIGKNASKLAEEYTWERQGQRFIGIYDGLT